MSDLDAIRERVDIVDLVGETVRLQRAGRTYKGLCPFHSEKTPSFVVSPERRSWHCFGACATGGDVFSFVMRRDNVEFGEAVRILAARAGINIKTGGPRPDPVAPRLVQANEAAASFYHHLLLESAEAEAARAYAAQRGLSAETIRDFEIGYAPESWDAAGSWLRRQGFEEKDLVEAGILVRGERGVHDRFRSRLMFPIRDPAGKVVGLGGRALGDGLPKYLNSPQSPIFDKGALLYALDRAAEAIRREQQAVFVEGYLDAITAHQYGYRNVVATLGTALNERHVALIKRYAPRVVLALDSDQAGIDAAVRGEQVIREAHEDARGELVIDVANNWQTLIRVQSRAPVEVRLFSVPSGKDPDEAIRAEPEAWASWVAAALPPFEFRLQVELRRADLSSARSRLELLDRMAPLLAAVDDRTLQAHYLVRLAETLRVDEEIVRARLSAQHPAARSGQPARLRERARPNPPSPAGWTSRAERFCLALLLQIPELRGRGLDLSPELFTSTVHRSLFDLWRNDAEVDEEAVAEELRDTWRELRTFRIVPSIRADPEPALEDCLARMRLRRIEEEKRLLTATLADATTAASPPPDEADAATDGPRAEIEPVLLRDVELGRDLHEIEHRLRTGKDLRGSR